MAAEASQPAPSRLERLLDRDRWLIAASLALLVIVAWGYLLLMSARMADGDMSLLGLSSAMPDMPEMPGMSHADMSTPPQWNVRIAALTFLMWWIMMVGMMVGSAAPMVLLFGAVQRRSLATQNPALRVAAFTGGYLLIWGAFSALATTAQWTLTTLGLLSAMELTTTRSIGALIAALAGVYQLSPLKTSCLRSCRSPAVFLSRYWRAGTAGALAMGVIHGAFCVGCCWLLMALLFIGGVMNLLWVAALAVLVLLEKILPRGELVARASGVALLGFSLYLVITVA